ncbi:MAG: PQQ-binding-like beta-propeller repeat protein [Candidatus Methanoperedens sp.]|nr:PQQ-binding-like beta-propeller repeat protein [Candidatus Methanoperedens sp.]MCZ7396499.1 PQQ-binding-like beta-propeller repeat protein [Candidatus Methanoperedens sp.]
MRLAICLLLVSMLATPAFASDWSMFKNDLSHSGFTTDTVNPPLTLKWTYDLGYDTESSPVIVGNVLYVGSNYGIHAIDVESGKELWRTSTDGFVKAVPTVVDGVLYVGPDARQFVAIDTKDGTIKWAYKNTTGGYQHSAAVVNNLVYVETDGTFYALNVQTGEPAWVSLIGRVSESSPAVAGGLIVFGTDKGLIMALDETSGKEKWRYDSGIADVVSSPLIANGTVFIGSNDGDIYALTMNGVLKWKYSTGNNVESSPSIKDGTIFVGSRDSNLYAIDAQTGALKWQFMAGGYVDSSPAISNDVVYFGARSNMIYALDADTGRVLWRNTTGQDQKDYITSPALSGNMLYAVTNGGRVLAFSGAQVTPAATATPTIKETTASPTATPTLSPTATPTGTRKAPGFEFSIIILLITIAIIKRWRNR